MQRAVSVRRIGPKATPHRTAELRRTGRPSLRPGGCVVFITSSLYSLHLTPGRLGRPMHAFPFPFFIRRVRFFCCFFRGPVADMYTICCMQRAGKARHHGRERDVDAAPAWTLDPAGLGRGTYALDAYATVVAWPHACSMYT